MLSKGKTLSKASEYEQLFGTRHRGPGRPVGSDGEVLFPAVDVHPALSRLAARRAFAVVHEEQRDRLADLYAKELTVLKRRGLPQVAVDCNLRIDEEELSAEEAA